jgi:hypothetical protein
MLAADERGQGGQSAGQLLGGVVLLLGGQATATGAHLICSTGAGIQNCFALRFA